MGSWSLHYFQTNIRSHNISESLSVFQVKVTLSRLEWCDLASLAQTLSSTCTKPPWAGLKIKKKINYDDKAILLLFQAVSGVRPCGCKNSCLHWKTSFCIMINVNLVSVLLPCHINCVSILLNWLSLLVYLH